MIKNAKAFSKNLIKKKDFASLSLNAITKILAHVREAIVVFPHAVLWQILEKYCR
jgi:CRISPR-associated endonuclease Csn1